MLVTYVLARIRLSSGASPSRMDTVPWTSESRSFSPAGRTRGLDLRRNSGLGRFFSTCLRESCKPASMSAARISVRGSFTVTDSSASVSTSPLRRHSFASCASAVDFCEPLESLSARTFPGLWVAPLASVGFLLSSLFPISCTGGSGRVWTAASVFAGFSLLTSTSSFFCPSGIGLSEFNGCPSSKITSGVIAFDSAFSWGGDSSSGDSPLSGA
mmetsp:Transcript_4577/g.19648  ORF Transcript_4577/g.19648 Transcript_4577/m.19648 type:complete len:214 (+) Transcript_4577:2690-3331(+)